MFHSDILVPFRYETTKSLLTPSPHPLALIPCLVQPTPRQERNNPFPSFCPSLTTLSLHAGFWIIGILLFTTVIYWAYSVVRCVVSKDKIREQVMCGLQDGGYGTLSRPDSFSDDDCSGNLVVSLEGKGKWGKIVFDPCCLSGQCSDHRSRTIHVENR